MIWVKMVLRFGKRESNGIDQNMQSDSSYTIGKKAEEVSARIQWLGDLHKDDLYFHSSLLSEFHCWYMKGKYFY